MTLPPAFGQARGSEHEAWLDESAGTVTKATHGGESGRQWGPRKFSTPAEYLERIAIAQHVFGMDWTFQGVAQTGEGPRIVTAQPLLRGPRSTPADIAAFMEQRGFQPVDHPTHGPAWYRPQDNLLVSDALPKNFVQTQDGPVPIDLQIQRPDAATLDAIREVRPDLGKAREAASAASTLNPTATTNAGPTIPNGRLTFNGAPSCTKAANGCGPSRHRSLLPILQPLFLSIQPTRWRGT